MPQLPERQLAHRQLIASQALHQVFKRGGLAGVFVAEVVEKIERRLGVAWPLFVLGQQSRVLLGVEQPIAVLGVAGQPASQRENGRAAIREVRLRFVAAKHVKQVIHGVHGAE